MTGKLNFSVIRRRFFAMWQSAGLLALVSASTAVALPPQYIVTDLGAMGGTYSHGWDINAKGHVVGLYNKNGVNRAFLYDGAMHDLGTLGGNESQARRINDSGLIVGTSKGADGLSRAFLYDGIMHDLGTLGGDQSFGFGINSTGHVAGYSDEAGGSNHAFLYDGAMHDLGPVGGTASFGFGVNDSGQVVGTTRFADGTQRGFFYDGETHDLGTLGGSYSSAYSINDLGQIVGRADLASGLARAYLYDGTMHDLGTFGGSSSIAFGINNSGHVVGGAMYPTTGPGAHYDRAFIYTSDSGMVDLNSLVDSSLGWELRDATAINDSGQIAGTGLVAGQTHAFLLTPVPEPTGGVLLLSAASGLIALLRRSYRSSSSCEAYCQ